MTAQLSSCLLLAILFLGGGTENVHAISQFAPVLARDRIAIVAPHPDDEVLATSGLIQQAVAAGAKIKIIYLTNGDHNQAAYRRYIQRQQHPSFRPTQFALGEQRRVEASAAMQLLGLASKNLLFLGYPDWSTLRLWRDYWEADEVLFNNATGVDHVPYPEDFSYRHTYRSENITADLCAVLRAFKPTRVFVTHPCDTHPDHRAAANFVQLALLELEEEGIRPALDFYIVHFGNWPATLNYHPTLSLDPPRTLRDDGDWQSLPLTPKQVQRKYQAILTNQTQVIDQRGLLTAFARTNELFATGQAPTVPLLPEHAELDWTKAAHLRALAVLPSESGYATNSLAELPSSKTAADLECIDFLRQDDDLIAQLNLKNLTGQRGNVRMLLFGYRQGTAFASLPKVQINITSDNRLNVQITHEGIEDSGVTLTNIDTRLVLRIPLKLLGGTDIDHLFTTAIAYSGSKIADDTAWHLLRIPPN